MVISQNAINNSEDEDWLDHTLQLLEEFKEDQKTSINMFPFQEQVVVLVEDGEMRSNKERKEFILSKADKIYMGLQEKMVEPDIAIGIGKWYQDTVKLNKSYQEAKLALQFGHRWYESKHILHINDLGILSLLIGIHQELLMDFSQEYLAPFMEGDTEQGTEYLKTLKAYIQYQGRINEVSKVLYIHPNTLRNRLKKIEEITGVNLQDHEELMNINIAVKILNLLGN